MRLIDADELPYSNITTNEYGYVETTKTVVLEEDIANARTVQAIIISDNASNGDMIKAMFGGPAKEGKAGILYKFKYRNGKPMFSTYFDFEWWNAPYK